MKKLYAAHLPFMVEQMKMILESNHIACVLRNAYLGGAAGELPPSECWPELWVLDARQYPRASELLEAFLRSLDDSAPAWRCDACGEQVGGQFGSCWRCGHDRPSWDFPG
jgi:hypothetical protein